MKSQTHYQVKTQTAGQVENKNQQYLPHKWRGNTLVPVIIALAISAIATIAFLNQGADLSVKNRIIVAQNEIASALSDWVVIRETSGVGTTATAPKPANRDNIFTANGTTFARQGSAVASAGSIVPPILQHAPIMVYETDAAASCKILQKRFSNKMDGFNAAYCINSAIPAVGSTEGEFLLIVLN